MDIGGVGKEIFDREELEVVVKEKEGDEEKFGGIVKFVFSDEDAPDCLLVVGS